MYHYHDVRSINQKLTTYWQFDLFPPSYSSSLFLVPGSVQVRFWLVRRMRTSTDFLRSGKPPAVGPASCSSISSPPAHASSPSSPSRIFSKPATTRQPVCSVSSPSYSPTPPSPATSSSVGETSCTSSSHPSPRATARRSSPPSSSSSPLSPV